VHKILSLVKFDIAHGMLMLIGNLPLKKNTTDGNEDEKYVKEKMLLPRQVLDQPTTGTG